MSRKLGAVVLADGVAGLTVLTWLGDGRTAYVHRNETLVASLPIFPGAMDVRETSSPHDPKCRPHAYTTTVAYRVPTGTRAAAVANLYATRLALSGWQ